MGNVSSVFSKSEPDPAAYSKQAAVNVQLQSAIIDLSGTISRINTAITDAAGFKGTLANLNTLKQRATTLQAGAPSMSPVDIEKARGNIEAELKVLQTSITSKADISASVERGIAVREVRERLEAVKADTMISVPIKKQYTDFSTAVDLSGGMTASSIRSKLSAINRDADVDRYKEFVFTRMLKFSASIAFVVFYYATLTLSILFGGIIISNMYFEEDFWAGRVFYFVYGMAFFPISLLVGIISPPQWLATIMPFFDRSLEGPSVDISGASTHSFLYTLLGSPLFGYNPPTSATSKSSWPLRLLSIVLAILFALFTYMRGLGKVNAVTSATVKEATKGV